MNGSAVTVVAAALAVAAMAVILTQGVKIHHEERALASYRAYLLEARQLSDAGQDPPDPEGVPLPSGYGIRLQGDNALLLKDGTVVAEDWYRRASG